MNSIITNNWATGTYISIGICHLLLGDQNQQLPYRAPSEQCAAGSSVTLLVSYLKIILYKCVIYYMD